MVRPKVPWDLVLAIALGLGALAGTLAPGNAATTFGGLALVLASPGYALTILLFPRRASIDALGRGILTVALSVALVVVLAFALALLRAPFNGPLMAAYLLGILVTISGAAEVRRRASASVPFYPQPPWPRLPRPSIPEAVVALGTVVVLVVAGITIYGVATRQPTRDFTVLYILGAKGGASAYPNNVTVGAVNRVVVGVVSRENSTVDFRLLVGLFSGTGAGGALSTPVPSLEGRVENFTPGNAIVTNMTLAPGERWEEPLDFTIAPAGTYRLGFYLLRGPDTIYREDFLWVTATA